VAAGFSVDPGRWREQFAELMGRIAGRFARVEPRQRARAFALGLLSGLRRKNCWTIAEQAGNATPDGMQHLLAGARWDADAVRDDVRAYVVGQLGAPDAVLVVDETGDVKKGRASAGVQRQYTGTAGRVENCQVAVFLSYAARRGHALIDRELYLPRSWTSDPARSAAAGIPTGTVFATKPGLARRMIARAVDAGTPAGWVAGDEVYGADPGLRADLEPPDRLRASGGHHPLGDHRRWCLPGRHARAPPAPAGLAAVLRWRGRQGAPLLRPGLGGHRPGPATGGC
jgi:SRSO17 transposase